MRREHAGRSPVEEKRYVNERIGISADKEK